MNNQKGFPEEFNIEAIKQVTERADRVAAVAVRLDFSPHILHAWIKRYSLAQEERAAQNAEFQRGKPNP